MPKKIESTYRSYQYLEPGADYRVFALAKEVGRVPEELVPLSDAEENA
jgi:membrane dipeptidase